MTTGLLLTLIGLALIDSTSIGTLGIPVFLLLTPAKKPTKRFLVYLATVAGCYFLLGIGLMFGLSAALNAVGDALSGDPGYWAETILGVLLFALSFRFSPKRRKTAGDPKWMNRLQGDVRAMVPLGVMASLAEAATMVPYLAAIGLITAAGVSAVVWVPILAGYSLVMIVPALVLIAIRNLAGEKFQAKLEKLGNWIKKNSVAALGWALAIVGFLLIRDGVSHLFFTN